MVKGPGLYAGAGVDSVPRRGATGTTEGELWTVYAACALHVHPTHQRGGAVRASRMPPFNLQGDWGGMGVVYMIV